MKRYVILCMVILALAGLASAQETRSTILGFVKDAQGAVVPNAAVVVTNTDTKATVRLTTSAIGYYEAPLLLPGPYTVSAELTGFKKAVRSGITLQVSDRTQIDLSLDVGAVTETVTVTAEAPLIDSTRVESGRVIDARSVQDLPIMANTVFTMIRYSAGIQAGGPPILLGPHSTQGGSEYNTGTGVGGNAWTIDGAVNDGNARYTANLPSVEAVAETKVLTASFDGSFGHSTGLGVAVMTKTGTNLYHGSATETYWNQRWQGSNLFLKQNYYNSIAALRAAGKTAEADAKAATPMQLAGHSNLWTLNVTGPVRIPKIFDGREKVFFAFNYNGEKDNKPEEASTYPRVVPTPANKTGDFSDLLKVASNPQQFQLYNPLSVRIDPNRSGHYIRDPFVGNVLPAQYIAMGKKVYDNYVKYWPDPNNWFDKTTTPSVNPFLSITAPFNWTFAQYSGRVDVNLGSKMRLFGRYTQNHFMENRADWTVDILPGLNTGQSGGVIRDDQNGVLDWVYTLSARTILHASASVSNWNSKASVGTTPFQFKPSGVGLPSYLDEKCGDWCYLPGTTINGYSQNGITGTPTLTYNRFWTGNADVYHNRGHHSLQFGLDIRQQVRSNHSGNNDGTYTFSNTYFRQCDDACANGTYSPGGIGLSWAAFMMGLPSGITISGNDTYIVGGPYYAWFAQDKWRVTPKLTLTLSLRSEYEVGPNERFGRGVIDYDKNLRLPISDLAEAAYAAKPIAEVPASQFKVQGGAIYASASGARKRAWDSQLMWLPRISFGYQLNPRTVVRGGYGIYYDTNNVNAVSYAPNQTGYSRSTNTTVTTDQGVTWLVGNPMGFVSPLNDPFPIRASQGNTRFDTPLRDALGNMALVGNSWTYPFSKHSRLQRWRIGIERQIGTTNVIEAAYEGTYTTDLNINQSLSSIPAKYYNWTNAREATMDSYMSQTAGIANPFNISNFASLATTMPTIYADMATKPFYTSTTMSRANLIRAYPNGNISVPNPVGKARSQQFNVSFNRRFSAGLTANIAYTAMITKSATSYFQNWSPNDPLAPQVPFWQRSGASLPWRIAATWVYDLPFGKGRRWLQGTIPDLLAGGWTLSGTYETQPGGLLGFGNYFYYGDVNNIKVENPTFDQYFNTAGCVLPTSTPGPGDTQVAAGTPCTQGWDKRSGSQPGTYQARSFPSNIEGLRGPGYQQWNGSVTRTIKLREPLTLRLRLDVLNALNHSFVNSPGTNPTTSATFGKITGGAANLNRFVQIQANLRW